MLLPFFRSSLARRGMPMVESVENSPPLAIIELTSAAIAVFDGFDNKSLRILQSRILAFEDQATLDELGQEFGLTRERIRQIEVVILKKIAKRIESPRFRCISRAAKSFATQLGLMVPRHRLNEITTLIMSSTITSKAPLLLPLLLWKGGPYGLLETWVVRKPISENIARVEASLPAPGVPATLSEISARLRGIGVSAEDPLQLLDYFGYRVFAEQVISWRGTLADKAYILLTNAGHPMTKEEISSDIPGEHSIRTLGNYLSSDGRFVRVNRTQFALSTWGMGAYKGIIGELTAEILRAGGDATLERLTGYLTKSFDVSERSIITYLNSPRFAKTSRGGFRVRRDDEDVSVQTRVELTRSCFFVRQKWSYRLQIDDELLRGSGRAVPGAFVQAVGICRGDVSTYSSEWGDYRISWGGPQPTIGSVRRFVEAFELKNGDWLYLAPGDGQLDVFAVRNAELLGLSDVDALFKQTCPDRALELNSHRAAVAVSTGLAATDTWTTIKRRFLERKELTLYSLVPDVESEEDESETLASLFEYIGSAGL
jgi:hypothetical protein